MSMNGNWLNKLWYIPLMKHYTTLQTLQKTKNTLDILMRNLQNKLVTQKKPSLFGMLHL